MFVLPPIALALTNGKKTANFYGFAKPKFVLLILVIIIMIVSMPFMEWTAVWNQKMVLPEGLKWLEKMDERE